MEPKFRIGLFTSAWDGVACELVLAAHRAVQAGTIPNAEIAFVLCTREEGETNFGDFMIQNALKASLPLIAFSSLRFKSDLRKQGREAQRVGDPSILEIWRNEHDLEIAKHISPTDLDVLLGYMWEFSNAMCRARKIINLHPALPTGPKGTYKEVIWELVRTRATETGVMMHLVTENLDRGSAISFCRFAIRGGAFDPLWQEMEQRLERESLDEIAAKEGEDNPLFKLIRHEGVRREFPMMIEAIKSVVEGNIRISNETTLDSHGQVLADGYDLTREIDIAIVGKPRKEKK
ncbi:MAG TPA: formyltransferase family protein [Candidatus Paceibacterota bacterium]